MYTLAFGTASASEQTSHAASSCHTGAQLQAVRHVSTRITQMEIQESSQLRVRYVLSLAIMKKHTETDQ